MVCNVFPYRKKFYHKRKKHAGNWEACKNVSTPTARIIKSRWRCTTYQTHFVPQNHTQILSMHVDHEIQSFHLIVSQSCLNRLGWLLDDDRLIGDDGCGLKLSDDGRFTKRFQYVDVTCQEGLS